MPSTTLAMKRAGRFSRICGLCSEPDTSSSLRAIFRLQTSHEYQRSSSDMRSSAKRASKVGMTGVGP